jgi:hypothetical protein
MYSLLVIQLQSAECFHEVGRNELNFDVMHGIQRWHKVESCLNPARPTC